MLKVVAPTSIKLSLMSCNVYNSFDESFEVCLFACYHPSGQPKNKKECFKTFTKLETFK